MVGIHRSGKESVARVRVVMLLAVFALCLGSETGWASKGRDALAYLKQLPLVVGKALEAGALQKAGVAVLALGVVCTGVSCAKLRHEKRYDLTRAERRQLTPAERHHIQQYVYAQLPMQRRDYSTYVHIDSKYRNTRQRTIYEGDSVYFLQDGRVYYGVVERHVHPKRVIVGQLYGSGIYDDLGQQKRMVDIDLIRGVSAQYHEDVGLMLVMENDDTIFRRDDDDYFARFHVRVVDVYDDGFYRMLVEYGTDAVGNRIYLQNSYTLLSHRNMWREDSAPLANHADLGVEAIILGPAETDIEYLLGKVTRVYRDGFYEIKISSELDFRKNHIELKESYSMFMHESTPLREGGFLLRRGVNF